jgi:hypothetical protein
MLRIAVPAMPTRRAVLAGLAVATAVLAVLPAARAQSAEAATLASSNAVVARPWPGIVRTSFSSAVERAGGVTTVRGSATVEHVRPMNVFYYARRASLCVYLAASGPLVSSLTIGPQWGVTVTRWSSKALTVCRSGNDPYLVPYLRQNFAVQVLAHGPYRLTERVDGNIYFQYPAPGHQHPVGAANSMIVW